MTSSLLHKLLGDPSLFNEETLPELKKIVNHYPAFSVAKVLYLKNLAVLNHPDFSNELKKMSIGIPDRRKLFLLIEDKLENQSSITMINDEERENSFELIDAFLSQEGKDFTEDFNNSLINSSVSSDYILWSLSESPQDKEEDKDGVQLKDYQLIDSFLKNEEERPKRFLLPEEASEEPTNKEDVVVPDFTKAQDDSFFTETLAQIYIKQKRYERALQIIKKLSLKYPEKNVYFADQIRFLEKLIINNKI